MKIFQRLFTNSLGAMALKQKKAAEVDSDDLYQLKSSKAD
jgi:hypothetical protein